MYTENLNLPSRIENPNALMYLFNLIYTFDVST